jgi:Ca-activated chloride channel family protein
MIRFAHDEYLYLLLLLPALALLYWTVARLRKKAIARFANPANFGRLAESVSRAKPVLKFAILLQQLLRSSRAWPTPRSAHARKR